jgi:hypothetical protein
MRWKEKPGPRYPVSPSQRLATHRNFRVQGHNSAQFAAQAAQERERRLQDQLQAEKLAKTKLERECSRLQGASASKDVVEELTAQIELERRKRKTAKRELEEAQAEMRALKKAMDDLTHLGEKYERGQKEKKKLISLLEQARSGVRGAHVGSPSAGVLTVELREAQDLRNKDTFSYSDPYCVLSVRPSQRRPGPGDSFQSQTINDNLHPVWNETFTFRDVTSKDNLEVEIFDDDDRGAVKSSQNNTLGTVKVSVADVVVASGSLQDDFPINIQAKHGTQEFKGFVTLRLTYTAGETDGSDSQVVTMLRQQLQQELAHRHELEVAVH